MAKWNILILVCLVMVSTVSALEECMREETLDDVPCYLVTAWQPPNNCTSYIAYTYNGSGNLEMNLNFSSIGDSGRCQTIFNQSQLGQYYINGTMGDSWNVDLIGDENMIFLLLIPLALAFMFIYWSNSIEQTEGNVLEPLRWFFRLFALIMVYVIYAGADIYINEAGSYSGLSSLFNITAFHWVFWTVMAAFLIYIIYRVFMSFKLQKINDFKAGRLR